MTQKLKWALLIAFIIKIILAALFDTADSGAMSFSSQLLIEGAEVYDHPQVNLSSPPLHLHLLGLIRVVSDIFNVPFIFAWKLPAIFADTGIAIFIYQVLVKKYRYSKKKASNLTLWFVLNPISLYVSGFHGQSEAVWILFCLLAWYAVVVTKKSWLGGLLTAIAVGYKLPAILLLPGLIFSTKDRSQQVDFVLSFTFFFGISLFPEVVTSREGLIREVFMYKSAYSLWGVTSLVSKVFQPDYAQIYNAVIGSYLKAIILAGSVLYLAKRYLSDTFDFFVISLYTIVLFLILTPGFGIQYMFWPLPFMVITNNQFLKLYTFWTTFAFVHTYGISWWIFSKPIALLQKQIYYKTKMLYPYDLYFPAWIVLIQTLKNSFEIKKK